MTVALRLTLLRPIAGAAILFALALGLTGCQMGSIQLSGPAPVTPQATTGAALSGTVHGGQYPIFNSTLQLYAAGAPAAPTTGSATGGLGVGATALIATGPMTLNSTTNYYQGGGSGCTYTAGNTNNCTALPATTANGSFGLSGDYSCPSSTSELYLVATGGDPTGAASTAINNQYIAMMAALGPCGTVVSNNPNVVLNEITTVAAVYSLNQFMAAPSGAAASTYTSQGGATAGTAVNIGASSGPVGGYGASAVQTQQIGLTNAFKMVNNISDYTQGTANPIAANTWASPYSAMTTTIADILAACINTNPAVSSSNCTNLMTYAKVGSVTPADTIQAAWMMARYPQGVTVSSLYGLIASAGAAFPNDLSTAPSQFTIEVGFAPSVTGGNPLDVLGAWAISNPISGAIDEYGNMWLWNYNPQGSAPYAKSFVSEIASNGAYLAGPFNSYTAHGGYQVSSADPCATTFTHNLSYSASNSQTIAIDQNNVVWVSNAQETTSTSGGIAGGNCSTGTANALMRITGSNANGTGAALTTGYYDEYAVGSLAIDGADNIWGAQSLGTQSSAGFPVITLTNSGTFGASASASPYSSAAPFNVFQSINLAIDAAGGTSGSTTTGNVWTGSTYICGSYGVVYESPTSSVSAPTETGAFYGSGTGCTTTALDAPTQEVNSGAGLGNPYGLAIDKNNGVWVPNYKNATSTTYGTVSYLLPSSSTWVNSGTQASPNTATQIPSTAATDAQSSGGNTYSYGLSNPGWVAVDGSNIAWVANLSSSTISPFQVSIAGGNIASITTPSIVGGGASGLKLPGGAYPLVPSAGVNWDGIDPSGNVWLLSAKAQSATSTSQTTYVTVVVGAATPVLTPLAFQVQYNRIGQTPQ